jgi:hypothetical protein
MLVSSCHWANAYVDDRGITPSVLPLCTRPCRSDLYWISRENSLELIELSCMCINKVSLSIRDDPYWIPRENSLELIELSCKDKVSLF